MARFKKKPVVIEAVQFNGGAERFEGDPDPAGVLRGEDGRPYVVTIHGQPCYVEAGDWIIPEPDGVHYYPCKNEVFVTTYEPVDTPSAGKVRDHAV